MREPYYRHKLVTLLIELHILSHKASAWYVANQQPGDIPFTLWEHASQVLEKNP